MKKNYFWIDLLKAIAAFAVIILHVTVSLLYDFGDKEHWQAANFYNSLVRFSVPVFVMISGVLLLNKNEELTTFLRKRFSRLLFPFIFWSVIYLFIKINYDLPLKEIISYSIKELKSGTEFHLWYIYMLIGLYLFIPILSKWTVNATKKEMIYFLSIWFFIIIVSLPFFNKFYTRIDFRYFSGYIGYLVLGTFLHRFLDKKPRWIGFLLFFVSVGFTILITYYLTAKTNTFNGRFYEFLGLNVVFASIGMFLILKDINTENQKFKKLIENISKYSYGIYLSHIFVLMAISKIGVSYLLFNPWLSIPFVALCVFSLSWLLTFLLSKIPLVGKYISG
jgi:surface polysaccharide O-acyltransferase-like enzyme